MESWSLVMKKKLAELNLEEIIYVSGGGSKEVSMKEATAGVVGTAIGIAAFHFAIEPTINALKNYLDRND